MKIRTLKRDKWVQVGRIAWEDGEVKMKFKTKWEEDEFSKCWNHDGSKIVTPKDGAEFMQGSFMTFFRSSMVDAIPEPGDPITIPERRDRR